MLLCGLWSRCLAVTVSTAARGAHGGAGTRVIVTVTVTVTVTGVQILVAVHICMLLVPVTLMMRMMRRMRRMMNAPLSDEIRGNSAGCEWIKTRRNSTNLSHAKIP